MKRISTSGEAGLAICCIYDFQDRFEDIINPKRCNVLEGVIDIFLKVIVDHVLYLIS